MDSALQRHVELPQLWRTHLRNKGRHGSPAARRLLQAASDGARSEAERLLVRLLRDNGITGWKTNYPVGGYKVDVAFPKHNVAIETDGCGLHWGHSPRKRGAHPFAGDRQEDFHNDRERQNNIALLGWQVLRFTWLDLTVYPQRVIAEIAAAIRSPR